MATNVTFNGVTYSVPAANEEGWQSLSNYLIALAGASVSGGSQSLAVRVATTATVTAATSDAVILINRAGAVTVNLPAGVDKQVLWIGDISGAAETNNITINRNGSNTIFGGTSYVLNQNNQVACFIFSSANGNWNRIAESKLPANGAANTILASDGTKLTYRTIVDADVNASAAIARSKLGTGTASHVVINSGAGAFSSEAQLAISRGGTGLNALGSPLQLLRVNAGGTALEYATTGSGDVVGPASSVDDRLALFDGTTGRLLKQASFASTDVARISTFGTGVATFLTTPTSANLRAAITDESGTGALLFQSGALGTPASGDLTSCTNLPVSTGISGLGTGIATFLATPSSANLRAAVTDESGTGALLFQSGALGTPSSGTLTSCTGLPISTGVSGLGTGVATALAVNTGSAGAVVLFNGALGTPTSGTLTNATGLPISTGVSGLGAGIATFLATPSSANLISAVTDETGSGALVFATSPTIASPILSSHVDYNNISTPATPSAGTLRVYSKSDSRLYRVDSTGLEVAIGGGLDPVERSTTLNPAVVGTLYVCNTSSAGFTITLPTGSSKASIGFLDARETFATNNLTIAPASGQQIDGQAVNETLVLDVSGSWVILTWSVADSRWVIQSSAPGSNNQAIVQNGNTLGAAMTIGTNDNFGVNIETNGTTKVAVGTAGDVTVGPTAGGVTHNIIGRDGLPPGGNSCLNLRNSNTGAFFSLGVSESSAHSWQTSKDSSGSARPHVFFAGDTEIGRYSNAGAWTLGIAGGTANFHNIVANVSSNYACRIENLAGAAANDSVLRLNSNTASAARIISCQNVNVERFYVTGAGDIGFGNNGSLGSVASTSVWTLGPSTGSAGNINHLVRGVQRLSTLQYSTTAGGVTTETTPATVGTSFSTTVDLYTDLSTTARAIANGLGLFTSGIYTFMLTSIAGHIATFQVAVGVENGIAIKFSVITGSTANCSITGTSTLSITGLGDGRTYTIAFATGNGTATISSSTTATGTTALRVCAIRLF